MFSNDSFLNSFENDFNLHLNINGDWKKLYSGGSFLALDLYNFNVGTIMKLNERDLITLNNNQTKGLYVDSLYEFSLILKRLA